jgi:hypothetical protein
VRGRSRIIKTVVFYGIAWVVTLSVGAGFVQAQGSSPGFQIGPVGVAPVFRLSEVGFDSNVYNRSDGNGPVGDFVTRMSPAVDASLRSTHLRASGHTRFDAYYFKKLPDLRAVDSDHSAQVDLVLNRVTLFVSGKRETTRHRRNLEIDAIARRRTNEVTAGVGVRLTGKTSFDVSVNRAVLKYDANSLFLDTDLSRVLNHKSLGETIAFRYAATQLTKFAVEVSRSRARFVSAVDRDSEEWRITPVVEFSPFALVSGRAAVGFYRRDFANVASQSTGPSALIDLSYTLLGRARFTVSANRVLQYSYLPGVADYVEAGVTGSVTQRLGESWDVGGRFGRSRLSYNQQAVPGVVTTVFPNETVLRSGVDVGYNLRRTRIGLYVEHDQRGTDQPALFRGYQRLRIGSSATYVF